MPKTSIFPRLSYSLDGDQGSFVLLVMGFGMTGAAWLPQIEALKAKHRVISYDHQGIGGSDAPVGLRTTPSMAEDALRLLDHVGARRAHVVGVSMGGMIAQEIALQAPGRVHSLSLVATHAGRHPRCLPTPTALKLFVSANLGNDPMNRVNALEQLLYTPEFLANCDQASLKKRMYDMVGQRAAKLTVAGHLSAVLAHSTIERLHAIKVPTLVVRPNQDILIPPSNSDVLAAHIPGAKLVRFDDAGHGITFQCAAKLNTELFAHFAETEAAEASRALAKPAPRQRGAAMAPSDAGHPALPS